MKNFLAFDDILIETKNNGISYENWYDNYVDKLKCPLICIENNVAYIIYKFKMMNSKSFNSSSYCLDIYHNANIYCNGCNGSVKLNQLKNELVYQYLNYRK